MARPPKAPWRGSTRAEYNGDRACERFLIGEPSTELRPGETRKARDEADGIGRGVLALSLTAGCSREPPPPADVTASTDQLQRVTIAWSIASGATPNGLVVSRNGAPVADLPPEARSYVDATATPGSVEAVRALDATSRTDGVALSWQAAAVHPGTSHAYTVSAVYPDNVIADSGLVHGARAAPVVTGYRLLRDGVELKLLTAAETDFVDLGEVDTFVAPTGFLRPSGPAPTTSCSPGPPRVQGMDRPPPTRSRRW